MGAIVPGVRKLNNDVIMAARVTQRELDEVTELQRLELERRERLYRGTQPPPALRGRVVVLIDDGIATGATVRAALGVIRSQHPARIVLATPVAQASVAAELSKEADEVVAVQTPGDLMAIGVWYDDLAQLSDREVQTILAQAAAALPLSPTLGTPR